MTHVVDCLQKNKKLMDGLLNEDSQLPTVLTLGESTVTSLQAAAAVNAAAGVSQGYALWVWFEVVGEGLCGTWTVRTCLLLWYLKFSRTNAQKVRDLKIRGEKIVLAGRWWLQPHKHALP